MKLYELRNMVEMMGTGAWVDFKDDSGMDYSGKIAGYDWTKRPNTIEVEVETPSGPVLCDLVPLDSIIID